MFIIFKQVFDAQRKLKQSFMLKYGIILATNMSSQYKSNSCVFLFMFIYLLIICWKTILEYSRDVVLTFSTNMSEKLSQSSNFCHMLHFLFVLFVFQKVQKEMNKITSQC